MGGSPHPGLTYRLPGLGPRQTGVTTSVGSATARYLTPGQYLVSHDLSACADGTAAGAVALLQRAKARGIVAKWQDGSAEYTPGGVRALAPACQAAGLQTLLYGYFYPGDGAAAAAQAQAGLATAGEGPFLLDCEIEFDQASDPAGAATTLVQAMTAAGIQPWLTSWGWPDQHSRYPWGQLFSAGCQAFAPQVYRQLLWGTGTPPAGWTDVCWNRAAAGSAMGGPAYTQDGPQGWEALGVTVVPVFDLSDVSRCAWLAHNAGFPAVCWWALDGMTGAQADQLAATPYAVAVPQPTAMHTANVTAALAAIGQAETALAAAKSALGRA